MSNYRGRRIPRGGRGGRGRGRGRGGPASFVSSSSSPQLNDEDQALSTQNTYDNMNLLTGPVIQIVVGLDNASERETWCLPKALISHHSSFLKAACSQPFKEKEENCIFLPEDNAKVFGFFVQWMYYAKYEEPNPTLFSSSIHAKACVLGDKFISKVFKNYAMGRLYAAHVSLQLLMGPADMVYMLENTIPHSELFRFYLDFLATNLGSDVVVGTKMDWDEVVLDYEEVRIAMLQVLMAGPTRLDFVRPLESYLDKESTSTDN